MIMLANRRKKINTPKYHDFFKKWALSAEYVPYKGQEYYDLLMLDFYEVNYAVIMKAFSNLSGQIWRFFLG